MKQKNINYNWVLAKDEYWLFDLIIRPLERMQLVYEHDLDVFVEDLLKSVAADLHVSYEELSSLHVLKNKAFETKKTELYKEKDTLSIYSTDFHELLLLLLVPKVTKLRILFLGRKKNFNKKQ